MVNIVVTVFVLQNVCGQQHILIKTRKTGGYSYRDTPTTQQKQNEQKEHAYFWEILSP